MEMKKEKEINLQKWMFFNYLSTCSLEQSLICVQGIFLSVQKVVLMLSNVYNYTSHVNLSILKMKSSLFYLGSSTSLTIFRKYFYIYIFMTISQMQTIPNKDDLLRYLPDLSEISTFSKTSQFSQFNKIKVFPYLPYEYPTQFIIKILNIDFKDQRHLQKLGIRFKNKAQTIIFLVFSQITHRIANWIRYCIIPYTVKQMSYFYSQPMTYCECMMPRQIAYQVMNELGQKQLAHFALKQVNFQSPYLKSHKRCDQALNKIRQLYAFIYEIKPNFIMKQPKTYKSMLNEFQHVIKEKGIPNYLYVNQIQDQIAEIHKYLISQKKQLQSQKKQSSTLLDEGALLMAASQSNVLKQFHMGQLNPGKQMMRQEMGGKQQHNASFDMKNLTAFQFKCYIIKSESFMSISKSLFRISLGNIYLQKMQIPTHRIKVVFKQHLQDLESKMVIALVFQQGSRGVLMRKIQKLMRCYEFSRQLTTQPKDWQRQLLELQGKVKQLRSLIELTQQSIQRYLFRLYEPKEGSSVSRLKFLEIYIHKQSQIYRQLSCCQLSENFIHFSMFMATKRLPLIIHPHANLPPLIMTPKPPVKQPPSRFSLPQVLRIPQQILNTYGVPGYGQYNPAITYIVTFGFFIGVMFGDVGHMLMTIPLLIYSKANIWAWTIIFWMGYCGVIYNQFFGLNLGLFDSCYQGQSHPVQRNDDCVYPIGIDSVWKVSQNQMQFSNSLKMKISVIIGVVHMLLGLGIRFLNNIRRKDYAQLFLLTVPQTVFMLSTFFYMDFLIVYKWLHPYQGQRSSQAPSIIATMIAIYAEFGYDGADGENATPIFWGNQRAFQQFLVVTCLLMIPIMLVGKPAFIYFQKKYREKNSPAAYAHNGQAIGDNRNDGHQLNEQAKYEIQEQQWNHQPHTPEKGLSDEQLSHKDNQQENKYSQAVGDESMKQLIVHQFIQTIQYVLGTVSNTASYLRLWALSLAHGQLSEVIFQLILERQIMGGYSKVIVIVLVFPLFFAVTFGVLICMDSMECFLHSLRLHWVEFQNKFYKGNGYLFQAFSFRLINKNK